MVKRGVEREGCMIKRGGKGGGVVTLPRKGKGKGERGRTGERDPFYMSWEECGSICCMVHKQGVCMCVKHSVSSVCIVCPVCV